MTGGGLRNLTAGQIARKTVFSTGQIARMLNVAPRTVTKWFDKKMMDGYRIPGSTDRRVTAVALLSFLRSNGLPIPDGLEHRGKAVVMFVGRRGVEDDGWSAFSAPDAFTAGMLCGRGGTPDAVVVDIGAAILEVEARSIARHFRDLGVRVMIGLKCEDDSEPDHHQDLFTHLLRKPVHDIALVAQIKEALCSSHENRGRVASGAGSHSRSAHTRAGGCAPGATTSEA